MKMFKKTIAMIAIVAIMVSTTAFAAFSEINAETTAAEVKAGDTFTIYATFDTLVNAKGMEIAFVYDKEAFTIDEADDEEFNYGTNKKPVYWANFIEDELKQQYMDECAIFNAWGSFSYNVTTTGVKFLSTDTEGGYVIEDGDEAEDMYPYKTIGVVFTANDDIAAGEYEFTINAIVSDATVGDISSSKTVKVTVAGEASKPVLVAGDETAATDLKADIDTIEGFKNYAIYAYTFSAPEKELAEGEIVNYYGFKIADKEKQPDTFDAAAIAGNAKCVLAIVGENIDATVDAFYNVSRWTVVD